MCQRFWYNKRKCVIKLSTENHDGEVKALTSTVACRFTMLRKMCYKVGGLRG